jgi:hypothetical protein
MFISYLYSNPKEQIFEFAGTDINYNIPINKKYKADKLTWSFFDYPMATADSLNEKFSKLHTYSNKNYHSWIKLWNVDTTNTNIFSEILQRKQFLQNRDLYDIDNNLDWFLPNLNPKVEFVENPVTFPDSINLANSRRHRIAQEETQIKMLKKLSKLEIQSEICTNHKRE